MTTFKIEKEIRWNSTDLKSYEKFIVWADSECLAVKYTENDAIEVYESAKKHYKKSETSLIKEETL